MPSEVTGRVGTSVYMSPEVADGWARYDSKVDIYRFRAASLHAPVHPALHLRASAGVSDGQSDCAIAGFGCTPARCRRAARPPYMLVRQDCARGKCGLWVQSGGSCLRALAPIFHWHGASRAAPSAEGAGYHAGRVGGSQPAGEIRSMRTRTGRQPRLDVWRPRNHP